MRIGFLLFDRITPLDFTGPYEVLASLPHVEIQLFAKSLQPISSDRGLQILPNATYEDFQSLDVFLVPGGPGINALLNDAETLAWMKKVDHNTAFMTSVCTGSLLLAAAGLLRGKKATTHWNALEFLRPFGVETVAERVVIDGRYITGGGVTSGIDAAFTIIAHVFGKDLAEEIQLRLEYDPQPPFNSGSPEKARPEILARYRERSSEAYLQRQSAVEEAVSRVRNAC